MQPKAAETTMELGEAFQVIPGPSDASRGLLVRLRGILRGVANLLRQLLRPHRNHKSL
jgi:hypothetical protein